ncbi:MAG TPA: M48 family metalloprotease [Terriglobales bacterium]|nr:M48 family metalloprotease [Terriglobales bacterium]
MYATLLISVCLAVFALSLVAGLLLVRASLFVLPLPTRTRSFSGLLFATRMAPFTLAVLISLGLALPAFVVSEPWNSGETPSVRLVALGAFGAAVTAIFLARYFRLIVRNRRVVSLWQTRGERVRLAGVSVPIFSIPGDSALLAVAGIWRPTVFVSERILAELTAEEMRAAVAHESAHIHSFDNFKQMLLRCTRMPGWFGFAAIERSWSESAELDADWQALRSGVSPLELGSAIVKVGRCMSSGSPQPAIAASHLVPSCDASALSSRAGRLQAVIADEQFSMGDRAPDRSWRIAFVLLALAGYTLLLSGSLNAIHEFIEVLVR